MGEILEGERFGEAETAHYVSTFRANGYVNIPGVLSAPEVAALKNLTDGFFENEDLASRTNPDTADPKYIQMKADVDGTQQPFILRNTIELDVMFRDLLVREPILGLAEAIVGEGCMFCGQNVLRNQPGVAIDDWHVDGEVHFPAQMMCRDITPIRRRLRCGLRFRWR
jgi:hypothetical protein